MVSRRPCLTRAAIIGCGLLIGCAAEVVRYPVVFTPATSATSIDQRVVPRDIRVTLLTGYERVIHKGTIWRLAGSVPQGEVFSPVDGVFSVEGAHVHEAYIVVNNGRLLGFYLPVERSFSALEDGNVISIWE